MTARKSQADKDAAAAAAAEQEAAVADVAPTTELEGTYVLTAPPQGHDVDGQEIDLAGQRVMLDALAETLAGLDAADIGRAIDLAPSVYLIHPGKGHVVHVTLTQAIADGALGWADATLDDIRRAGLTS